ncbi:MAG: hypothetical protein OXI22_03255 [Defluviicoccus sp.]|nr:hypothetical protein [Defluviicoccus sp.]MDE0382877.1 hypothetical protein [Defluviicoccus sp.]
MLRRPLAALAACALLLSAAILPGAAKAGDSPIFAAAHGGTLGAGLMAGYDISPAFSARAMASYFAFGTDESTAGNDYSIDLQLLSLGVMGDWHPFENGFRVTAGGLFNGNKVTMASSAEDLDLAGASYRGNMEAELGFNAVAPYVGIGWTSGRADGRGLSFFADAGVIFQGSPKISASGRVEGQGSTCGFDLSEGGRATVGAGCGLADLRADLESEHADLEDQLSAFNLYPVLMLGVAYRF